MTEEKLSREQGKAPKSRVYGLFLAAFAISAGGIWLFRQPIAEAIARGVCSEQKLSCNLSITRLDFGGVTLTSLDARAPGSNNAAVTAQDLVVDLAWDGLFSPRVTAVRGDALVIRVDLTGKRSVFGDLETAITNFTKPSDKPAGPAPKLQIRKLDLIADTVSGPLIATGQITATGADAFVVDLAAKPTALGLAGATVDLNTASLHAIVANGDVSGRVLIDAGKFTAYGASFVDLKVDASLEQSRKPAKDVSLAGMQTKALANAAASSDWLSTIQRLQVTASLGAGEAAGATWKDAKLTTLLQPVANKGAGGDILLVVNDLRSASFAAGEAAINGKVELAGATLSAATGTLTVRSGVLPAPQRQAVVNAVGNAVEAVLPPYATALRNAINRAGQGFDANIPWSVRNAADGLVVSLDPGASVKAASGLLITVNAAKANAPVATYTAASGGSWVAAGEATMQGGGGPTVVLDIDSASGKGQKLEAAGNAYLRSWKIGSDVVAADLSGLTLAADGPVGAAAGRLKMQVEGGLAGGKWKGAQAEAQIRATWDDGVFVADAPDGALLQWKEARFGGSIFGAAALRYTAIGHLAERTAAGLVGKGQLAAVSVPVKGDGYAAAVQLGAVGVNWRAESTVRANFNMAPARVDLTLDQRTIPIRIGGITGEIDLASGWKVAGAFKDGSAHTDEGHVDELEGKFDLAGAGGALSGSLSDITMRLSDPLKEEGRRYEDLNFRGAGTLRKSVVDFDGAFSATKSGMQVAHVTGKHSLETNSGGLTFDPTPLIFSPRQFQPSDLSPLLVGPANVTGRLDVGGAASWNADGLKASGVLNLQKLGFTLASAGVFEGVSGRIEVADLINMKSAPGQKVTLDKVTLGLPIEKGEIGFTLVGYDSIKLDSAQWPFGGGFIRIDPQTFTFSSEAQNRIVARAVDWDLAKLADQFKLPDMKLQGIVGGEFPVMFTTGSAVIDHATLKSVKPGVIQYSGSTGDAAAQSDANSKMLFDALKDFHYEVLQVGLDGNLTGKMMLTLSILGRNPDVLSGQPFQLNIGIDSALVPLLTTTLQRPDVKTAIEQTRESQK